MNGLYEFLTKGSATDIPDYFAVVIAANSQQMREWMDGLARESGGSRRYSCVRWPSGARVYFAHAMDPDALTRMRGIYFQRFVFPPTWRLFRREDLMPFLWSWRSTDFEKLPCEAVEAADSQNVSVIAKLELLPMEPCHV